MTAKLSNAFFGDKKLTQVKLNSSIDPLSIDQESIKRIIQTQFRFSL